MLITTVVSAALPVSGGLPMWPAAAGALDLHPGFTLPVWPASSARWRPWSGTAESRAAETRV